MYEEADREAQLAPACKLQNRLLFHLCHKFGAEKRLMAYHQNLEDVIEDQVISRAFKEALRSRIRISYPLQPYQLTLASIHYLRGHFKEAVEVYKRIFSENR